ncbi:uncharacterized protein BP5553_06587 [Venustampulla echinocandica]|uniref:Uncharacterized protein n=1 Tax=Venustampulla echinocandica TaxID=2656787 RepID=A0A370TKD3_9HELO|nr:uncharacterized protein BP5553_06587 [Venustampulla echinocandica]RDL35975.1 hypothetical protein BP5553_06587 [Venustampulla echinocandica]
MAQISPRRKRAKLSDQQEIEEEASILSVTPPLKAEFQDLNIKAFLSNVTYLIGVQDNDQIFKDTFEASFINTQDIETINGVPSTLKKFFDFLQTFRSTLKDRFLLNQQFVVVPSDSSGELEAGSVAHSVQLIGFTQTGGKKAKAKATIVALVTIQVINCRQQIVLESFIEKLEEL